MRRDRVRFVLPAIILATLPGRAGAQSMLTGSAVHVEAPPVAPLILTAGLPVHVTDTSPDTLTTTGALKLDRWTLQSDTSWNTRDPHSQVSARATYSAPGGFRLSAGVIGRSRYVMPLAVAQALGSNGNVQNSGGAYFEPVGHAMVWDTQIRVEKTLKKMGTKEIRAVGEVFTLFGTPLSSRGSLLTSRAIRVGVVIAF